MFVSKKPTKKHPVRFQLWPPKRLCGADEEKKQTVSSLGYESVEHSVLRLWNFWLKPSFNCPSPPWLSHWGSGDQGKLGPRERFLSMQWMTQNEFRLSPIVDQCCWWHSSRLHFSGKGGAWKDLLSAKDGGCTAYLRVLIVPHQERSPDGSLGLMLLRMHHWCNRLVSWP